VAGTLQRTTALGRNVDTLLQAFENRRAGLTDEQIAQGPGAVNGYFLEIYDHERERLRGEIRDAQPHLNESARESLFKEVDALMRETIIPGYVRLALAFTPKERSDFFLVKEHLRVVERIGWAFAGLVLGFIFVRLPFVPLFLKELMAVFVIGGFVWPEIRRFFSFRRYEKELNQLVVHADRELERIDRAYLSRGETIDELRELEKEQ
jgi:hypothetical protein